MCSSSDAISSGDDEDDTERSEDIPGDGEQMREYPGHIQASCHLCQCVIVVSLSWSHLHVVVVYL